MNCSKCGCTQFNPCATGEGGTCHWVLPPSNNMPGVCSECATTEDYAMAQMIREAQAGWRMGSGWRVAGWKTTTTNQQPA